MHSSFHSPQLDIRPEYRKRHRIQDFQQGLVRCDGDPRGGEALFRLHHLYTNAGTGNKFEVIIQLFRRHEIGDVIDENLVRVLGERKELRGHTRYGS